MGLASILDFITIKCFRKKINEALLMKSEIAKAMNETANALVQQSLPTYSSHEIAARYFNDDTHLATISFDGENMLLLLNIYHHLHML